MEIGSPEAIRNVVAVGLGVSVLVPEVVAGSVVAGGVVVRPLSPALVRGMAIVQRKDKPDDAALGIVREALMTLATG
jgi:DNA-binding transcriptional LysR family regulator